MLALAGECWSPIPARSYPIHILNNFLVDKHHGALHVGSRVLCQQPTRWASQLSCTVLSKEKFT